MTILSIEKFTEMYLVIGKCLSGCLNLAVRWFLCEFVTIKWFYKSFKSSTWRSFEEKLTSSDIVCYSEKLYYLAGLVREGACCQGGFLK